MLQHVVEKAQISVEFFTSYLHENYLEFYTRIDDVVTASGYFSDADYVSREWAVRVLITSYCMLLAQFRTQSECLLQT